MYLKQSTALKECKLQVRSIQQQFHLWAIRQTNTVLLHPDYKLSLTRQSMTSATVFSEQPQPAQPRTAQHMQSGLQKERCRRQKQPSKPALGVQSQSMVSCQLASSAIPSTMQAAWISCCQVMIRHAVRCYALNEKQACVTHTNVILLWPQFMETTTS